MEKSGHDITKAYEPQRFERDMYHNWETSGFFNPDNLKKGRAGRLKRRSFSIAMPPPNTTGRLHLGHASSIAYEDVMVRYKRLQGFLTLYLPGTDHAAIATQNKVEQLLAKEGTSRSALGRERFLGRVRVFVSQSQRDMKDQIRRLGASCDWSREAYTLDEVSSRVVAEVFVRMYHDGLIYRGNRICNWCPRCSSTLADDEVLYVERTTPFYYLKYGPVVIGTARPETKFLDKTIVVHPDDARYQQLIGKEFEVPWIEGTVKARVIADPIIDKDLGTGAMTLTPAHSFEDFELAKKHKLEVAQIIGPDGRLTEAAGSMRGMLTSEARKKVVEVLKRKGLIDRIDTDYVHNLSVCYRCETAVEPLISKQWFVNVNKKVGSKHQSLKELATELVRRKEVAIIPERFRKVYFQWMDNLHDWCISRQIWWGHRIPVWYRESAKFPPKADRSVAEKGEKLWDLKIYGRDIFQGLVDGTKTIEIRAGRARGTGKYWGDFKAGDSIQFRLADEKTDEIIRGFAPVRKLVKCARHFKTLDDIFMRYLPEDDYPGASLSKLKHWWSERKDLTDRIRTYGVWVIELANAETKELYVGVNPPKGEGWEQDPDTLDTWFSSATWTFSTLLDRSYKKYKNFDDWLKRSPDIKRFHPTSVLETGYDILFFWVARMILVTAYIMQERPFETVYLHGLVRDKQGRKMAKSLGNVIDPIDVIEKYGADALRLSLIIGSGPGQDVRMYEEKIAGYRNFVNKLWNVSRFILTSVDQAKRMEKRPKPRTISDRWILARTDDVVRRITRHIDQWQFSLAGEVLYDFTWHDLADWYLEIGKIESKESPAAKQNTDAILLYVLEQLLVLWHPFAPFVTEVLWAKLGVGYPVMVAQWPKLKARAISSAKRIEQQFQRLKDSITAIRTLRAENKIPAGAILPVHIAGWSEVMHHKAVIEKLARCSMSESRVSGKEIRGAGFVITADVRVQMNDAKREALKRYVTQLEAKLTDENFVKRAPAAVVALERKKLAEAKERLGT